MHVTLEYMIMVPLLIMQILIFPYAATVIMSTWTNQQETLELQEVAGHLGSSIQQLYYTINHATISSGALTATLDTPAYINGFTYNITFSDATNGNTAIKILNVTISLHNTKNTASSLVTLGDNAAWVNGAVFVSNKVSTVNATKTPSSIWLSLIGGT